MKVISKNNNKESHMNELHKKLINPDRKVSKKFLAVFDGFDFSNSTLDYAIQLSHEADAFLIGIFLDDSTYRSYEASEVIKSGKNVEKKLKQMDEKDQAKRDEAVSLFQKACSQAGIQYTFHRYTDIANIELHEESIFSDLIIINISETFTRFKEKPPTRFIRQLLTDMQCPVLVVPDEFQPVDKVTLLYDGGPSSVYAIKMFSYLLSNTDGTPVEVLTVKEKDRGSHLPNNKLMREFIKRHFPKAKYVMKKGVAEEQVTGHLRNQKGNELVVMGAYRRNEISRWFKTSMADVLMRELKTPLFIAHNK